MAKWYEIKAAAPVAEGEAPKPAEVLIYGNIGDRWNDGDHRYESRPRQVERCQVHDNYRQVVTGYDVRYRFEGRDYATRLPYDPGKFLTLNVNFSVADDQRGGWRSSRNDWND